MRESFGFSCFNYGRGEERHKSEKTDYLNNNKNLSRVEPAREGK